MHKTISIKVIVLISLLFTACNHEKVVLTNNPILFSEFPREDTLSFKNIYNFKEGNPKEFRLIDSNLVIFNYERNAQFFIYNYSLKNGNLSKGFIRKGKGPGEAIGAFNFGINNKSLWIHDVTLKKILVTNIEKIISNTTSPAFEEYPINDFYFKIDFIDSVSFFSVGAPNSSYKISKINLRSNSEAESFGSFKVLPPSIPIDAVKDAYLSLIYSKPSGDKIALPYIYTDVLEIYDIKSHECIAVQGPERFDVDFTVGKNSRGTFFMENTRKTRKAFLKGAVTNKYIYILYSGHSREDDWNVSKYIYVYDWDGNPIKKLVLDRFVPLICVTENDKVIYSYDQNTGYILQSNIE